MLGLIVRQSSCYLGAALSETLDCKVLSAHGSIQTSATEVSPFAALEYLRVRPLWLTLLLFVWNGFSPFRGLWGPYHFTARA